MSAPPWTDQETVLALSRGQAELGSIPAELHDEGVVLPWRYFIEDAQDELKAAELGSDPVKNLRRTLGYVMAAMITFERQLVENPVVDEADDVRF